MNDEIPQWAFDLFCERAGVDYQKVLAWPGADGVRVRKLTTEGARTIAQHEEPPVDANLQMARDSAAEAMLAARPDNENSKQWAIYCRGGAYDDGKEVQSALIAIRKLMESGK